MKIITKHLNYRKPVRPGNERVDTLYIDVHDPGEVMTLNRLFDYFNDKKNTRPGSYNYIVDHDGKVYEFIPREEVSVSNGHFGETPYMAERFRGRYKDGWENYHSVSFCMLHVDTVGHFTKETWKGGVDLGKFLIDTYDLDASLIIPHFMLTWEKVDPRWFLKHPDELERFRFEISKT